MLQKRITSLKTRIGRNLKLSSKLLFDINKEIRETIEINDDILTLAVVFEEWRNRLQ